MVTAMPDMTGSMDRMEKAGWVTRKRADHDRGQVSTHITKSGLELLARLEKPPGDFMTPLFCWSRDQRPKDCSQGQRSKSEQNSLERSERRYLV
jgi:DNA-binding MarR family transcriptional regulator